MAEKQSRTEEEQEQEINLLELVQVLVKHKMFIIKMTAVAVVASVAYCLTLPNVYTATARVLPPQKEGAGGLSALLSSAGGLGGLMGAAAGGFGGSSELYLGILKSRSVGDAVVQRLNLAAVYRAKTLEEARKRLDGAVNVKAGKEGIISISASDTDPKRAALVANTIVDELGRTTVRLNLSKAGSERSFLEKRLELVKKELKGAEEELRDFALHNKVAQVDSQARASIEGIARLKAELATKEVQLAVLTSNQTDQSPEVQAAQSGIKRLRAELAARAGSGSDGAGIPTIGSVPSLGLQYARKLREFKTQEAIFEQLTKQYEVAKLNEARDSSSFQVLDDAVVPVRKSSPQRSLIVLATTMAVFFISILAAFFREYLSRMSDEDRRIMQQLRKSALTFRSFTPAE